MKTTQFKTELKSKSIEELNVALEALLRAHFSLRLQKGLQSIGKTIDFRTLKRNIARVRTIITEKTKKAVIL